MAFTGLKSIARNSAYLLGGQVAAVLVRAAYVLLLARWLPPEDYGALNYGFSWYLTLIALTYLGQDLILSREIGQNRAAAAQAAGTTLAMRGAAIVLVTLVSASAALILEPDAETRTLLLILSVALVARSVWIWSVSLFTALEHTAPVMALDLLFRPAELLGLLLYLWLFGPDLPGIAAIHALSWCLQAGAGMAAALRHTRLDFSAASKRAAQLLKQGVPGMIYVVGMAWFLQAPVVLFRHLATGEALGHFALAYQVLVYLLVIPSILSAAALPVLVRSAARQDGKDRSMALALLFLLPLIGTAAGLSASWLAEPLVRLIFGAEYAPAGDMLVQAIWLLIPFSLATLLQQFVFSKEAGLGLGSTAPLVAMSAMIVLFVPMTYAWGYSGAFVATFLGMSLWVCLILAALARTGFFAPPQRQAAL